METTDDVLHQFYEIEKIPDRKNYILASILFVIHNIVSIWLFFLSLQMAGIETSELFSKGIFLFQLFVFRVLPVTALLLFLWRKRAGWVLSFFFSSYDWLQKFYFSIDAIVNFDRYSLVNPFLHWGVFLTFVLSGTLIILLLLKDVRRLFKVTPRLVFTMITISIITFVFIRFYVTSLLLHHLHI